MMCALRHILTAFTVAAAITMAPGDAVARSWETVKSERNDAKSVIKEAEIEIKAAPALIIVSSDRQVKVQVFTILGRLVSSETVPPGTSQLSLPAHGVYIVKVGELTCKVAV